MMLFRFYNWFSRLKEPWRFLVAMAVMSPMFLLFGLESYVSRIAAVLYGSFIIITGTWWEMYAAFQMNRIMKT